MVSLPIDSLLPDVVRIMRDEKRLVLRAPPGAGKTTRVPAALLDAGIAGDKHVCVLEPRRIAARSAASFVASERGGSVGGEVGYRVRFESRGGRDTRLWFLTEGVLGRQLTRDPFLEDVSVVVLDEFHERHLQGDVALAILRELQETVRSDLRVVVMSATLETTSLSTYLGDCSVLTSEGRAHPVAIEYLAEADPRPLSARVATALRRLLETGDDGDVLVFLPGAAEIRRTADAVESVAREHGLAVVTLHGDLPLDQQQLVVRRSSQRRVVLSTNVAETALTIEGVAAVIDGGVARMARFDAKRGVNILQVSPISRASAEQRAGRAGRTRPGRCIRLWTEAQHAQRLEREPPEVARLDLSATVLELHAWGLRDIDRLAWLDAPPPGALRRAESLLAQIGAIDAESRSVTETGRRMLAIAAPPRLARLLVEAERRDCTEAGALLAALASERDICVEERVFGEGSRSRSPSGPSDLLLRAELFEEAASAGFGAGRCRSLGLDPRALRAVDRARRQMLQALGGSAGAGSGAEAETLLACILAGFPDRVARRRAPGSAQAKMVGGGGVVLSERSVVRDAELFVAIDVEAGRSRQRAESLIRLASAVDRRVLARMFPDAIRTMREVDFDAERERVVERTRELYLDLVLVETMRLDVEASVAAEVLAAAALRDLERAVLLGDAERSFLERLAFLQRSMPELGLPDDTNDLVAQAVRTACVGRRSFAELRKVALLPLLSGLLTYSQKAALDREAPSHYRLPNDRLAAIIYERDKPPSVAARIQELFGLTATPRLAAGRVPLVIELLGPNFRPVQITDDLESFWSRTYSEVRKDLRGRYPKHAWPEDPLTAKAVSRSRRPKA